MDAAAASTMTVRAARRAPYPLATGDSAVALAKLVYALRGARSAYLPDSLFGEPAWDILLDLYVSEAEGRRLGVSAVCIGARSSHGTGVRHLGILEEQGLVERRPDGADRRRWFVTLTQAGYAAMQTMLTSVAEAAVRPSRWELFSGAIVDDRSAAA